jgi:hypothetical protein
VVNAGYCVTELDAVNRNIHQIAIIEESLAQTVQFTRAGFRVRGDVARTLRF